MHLQINNLKPNCIATAIYFICYSIISLASHLTELNFFGCNLSKIELNFTIQSMVTIIFNLPLEDSTHFTLKIKWLSHRVPPICMWNDRFSCTDYKQIFIVIINASSPQLLRSQDFDHFLRPIKEGVKIISIDSVTPEWYPWLKVKRGSIIICKTVPSGWPQIFKSHLRIFEFCFQSTSAGVVYGYCITYLASSFFFCSFPHALHARTQPLINPNQLIASSFFILTPRKLKLTLFVTVSAYLYETPIRCKNA